MHDQPTPLDRARALLWGFQLSHAMSAAAALGVGDALAGGPRGVDEIAGVTGTDEAALYRLLRALAAAGLLHEGDDRRFSLTDLGTYLRNDVEGSIAAQAIFYGRPYVHETFSHLEHSIRTGDNAFVALHGEDQWQWRAHEPGESEIFDRAMAGISSTVGPALARAYDFDQVGTLVDVGGGSGALLATLLARYPRLRGVLFDQAHVVAAAADLLERAGVLDRCEIVGGDFFERLPAGDAHLMKSILHDWDDEPAVRILRTVRAAARPGSTLLLVERVVGPPNEDLPTKLMDLHMLVALGGRERTADAWERLLGVGGFVLEELRPVAMGFQLMVATAR